jgi:DNA-binding LacI/PurR family transcriptional regulator
VSTIKDVARRAGVAISTVSAVINRSAPVSAETIARVQKAISEIGYLPHGAAQSLRSGQSRVIGLILPDIMNPHFAAVARVVEAHSLAAGYMAAVYSTSEDFDIEAKILRMMRHQRVAGLIIIPTRSDAAHGARLRSQIHVPTILLDSYVEGLGYDVVKLDNRLAGRIATEHLLELGHRRIAVTTGRDNIITGVDRLQGYIDAHRARDLPVDEKLFLLGRFDQAVARESTLAAMQRKDRPTAVFALSNMMALGVYHALRNLGLSVPSDVSVISIDDFEFAAIMNPPPTVVAAPVSVMAQQAIELLLEEIARKRTPTGQWQMHTPTLVLRDSCRTIGIARPARAGRRRATSPG